KSYLNSTSPHEDVPLLLKGPVPPAQQDGNVGGVRVCEHQVEEAVAVEVGRVQLPGHRSSGVAHLGSKRAIPPAQQDRNVAGALIGGGQVEAAVAVKVPRDDAERIGARNFAVGGLKRPVPQPQQDRNTPEGIVVGGRKVQVTV